MFQFVYLIDKSKSLFIILTFMIVVGCTEKVELDGLWQGQRVIESPLTPSAIKIEDNLIIDIYSNYVAEFTRDRSTLFWKDGNGDQGKIDYELVDSTLYFYVADTDSLISKFERPKSKNIIDDIILNKSIDIQLPEGKGVLNQTVMIDNLRHSVYVYYKNHELTINYKGIDYPVDDSLFKVFKEELNFSIIGIDDMKAYLIADKSIRLSEIELIKQHLKAGGYTNITFLLSTNGDYQSINSLSLRLEPLIKKDSIKYNLKQQEVDRYEGIPEFKKNSTLFLNFNGSNLNISSQSHSIESFQKEFVDKNYKEDTVQILFSFDDKADYQVYITALDVVYNSIIGLRKSYLKEIYNIDYHSDLPEDEKFIQESIEKFPLIFANKRILIH